MRRARVKRDQRAALADFLIFAGLVIGGGAALFMALAWPFLFLAVKS
jgi:hypothetical protein